MSNVSIIDLTQKEIRMISFVRLLRDQFLRILRRATELDADTENNTRMHIGIIDSASSLYQSNSVRNIRMKGYSFMMR